MAYTIEEHRHRFAVWAAARAAQRGFRAVSVLRRGLEASDIRTVLGAAESLQLGAAEFDDQHRRWCRDICSNLTAERPDGVTFGRAAKLVAVYLKTVVLMGEHWDSPLGRNLHPPIDRRLLKALVKSRKDAAFRGEWATLNWTALKEQEYYRLIAQLRSVLPAGAPFWTLEADWQPSDVEG